MIMPTYKITTVTKRIIESKKMLITFTFVAACLLAGVTKASSGPLGSPLFPPKVQEEGKRAIYLWKLKFDPGFTEKYPTESQLRKYSKDKTELALTYQMCKWILKQNYTNDDIRSAGSTAEAESLPGGYHVNEPVEINYQDKGIYYGGKIAGSDPKGRGDHVGVIYDDTPSQTLGVPLHLIRRLDVEEMKTDFSDSPRSEEMKTDISDSPRSLPGAWEEQTDEDGNTYYWNRDTHKSQWERPASNEDEEMKTETRPKRALLVSMSYSGGSALEASPKCQQLMKHFIQERGFQDEDDNIKCLNDFKGKKVKSADLESSIARLKEGAKAGDVLFFYFSGHGGLDSDTAKNFLCLTDHDYVYDLKEQLTRDVPPAVTIIVVLDCCHSGEMMKVNYEIPSLSRDATEKWVDIWKESKEPFKAGERVEVNDDGKWVPATFKGLAECRRCKGKGCRKTTGATCTRCGGSGKGYSRNGVPDYSYKVNLDNGNSYIGGKDDKERVRRPFPPLKSKYPKRKSDEPVIVSFTACTKDEISFDDTPTTGAYFTKAFVKAASQCTAADSTYIDVYEAYHRFNNECLSVRMHESNNASGKTVYHEKRRGEEFELFVQRNRYGGRGMTDKEFQAYRKKKVKQTPRCETNSESLNLRSLNIDDLFNGICDENGKIKECYTKRRFYRS